MSYEFVSKAAKFADFAHRSQFYGDFYYIYHLEGVKGLVELRNKFPDQMSTILAAAYLHDVLEDTEVTFEELDREFGRTVALVVQYVTKVEGESYEDYMNKVLSSVLATEVKKCDTMFNLNNSFKEGNQKRIAKYIKQLDILERGYL